MRCVHGRWLDLVRLTVTSAADVCAPTPSCGAWANWNTVPEQIQLLGFWFLKTIFVPNLLMQERTTDTCHLVFAIGKSKETLCSSGGSCFMQRSRPVFGKLKVGDWKHQKCGDVSFIYTVQFKKGFLLTCIHALKCHRLWVVSLLCGRGGELGCLAFESSSDTRENKPGEEGAQERIGRGRNFPRLVRNHSPGLIIRVRQVHPRKSQHVRIPIKRKGETSAPVWV